MEKSLLKYRLEHMNIVFIRMHFTRPNYEVWIMKDETETWHVTHEISEWITKVIRAAPATPGLLLGQKALYMSTRKWGVFYIKVFLPKI